MNKVNPYESSQLDDTESGRSVLIFAAFTLAILIGMATWQSLTLISVAAGVLLIFVLVSLPSPSWPKPSWLKPSSADWKERWPTISDDDFVAKCAPGTDRVTALKVRRIVSEQLGIDYDRIHPDQSFVADLGCE